VNDLPSLPLWPDNPTSEDLLGFGDVAEPIMEALRREQLDPQYNILKAERVRALYPHWHDWMAVQGEFNRSGVFDSPFTYRLGISSSKT
jgi:hypothetical protein